MSHPIQLAIAIPPVRTFLHRFFLDRGFGLCLALAALALAPAPSAFGLTPAPDGGYPGFNTAEGEDALFNLDTVNGLYNTAIGFRALFDNTIGDGNTATGAFALRRTVGDGNTATGESALRSNVFGNANTAMGSSALFS